MEEFEKKSELVAHLNDQPEGTQAFWRTTPSERRRGDLRCAAKRSGYSVATEKDDCGFLVTKGAPVSSEVRARYKASKVRPNRSYLDSGNRGLQGEHAAQISDLTEVGQMVTTTQTPKTLRMDAKRYGIRITSQTVTLPDGSRVREVTRIA